jgi:hypothetical protein
MPSPFELYPLVMAWLQALDLAPQARSLRAVADLVTALLSGQSLRPSALMRALLSPEGIPARQRYKRVARCWARPWLSPAWLSPRLVPAVLALVAPDPVGTRTAGLTHVALDSVRCGPWEVFTLGVVWSGRVVPVGWAVLPYPWPKRRFTPTVCALLQQVAAAWPAPREAHLVADRAFASRALLLTLRQAGWGCTLRLRARHTVTVGDGAGGAGPPRVVRDLLATARLGAWTAHVACYGSGPTALPGHLVLGRGLPVLPWHQRDASSRRHRAAQQARRQRHLASKHPGRAADASAETDAWVVLFTTHSAWQAATDSYRRRWATEGSYRDAQSGWDGRHGWALEPVLARGRDAVGVERVVGLWALGALLQTWIGAQVCSTTDPLVQTLAAQWTTTGRLSIWARGQFALQDRSGHLRTWLIATLTAGATRVAAAPPAVQRPVPPLPCTSGPTPPAASARRQPAA